MKITHIGYSHKTGISFQSNARKYRNHINNEYMHTLTYMFREDIDWKEFTKYAVDNFKDKDKVQFLQFASSDGTEAYTQIITLLESYPEEVTQKLLPILAYDIDDEVINAAKSGFLNLTEKDKSRFSLFAHKNFSDYFKPTNKELEINNDALIRTSTKEVSKKFLNYGKELNYTTYSVSNILKKAVKFAQADMVDVLLRHEDEENSIILCRNVLGHLSLKQVEFFLNTLQRKLKKGSLFVIGDFDATTVLARKYLETKGFKEVLHNVYRKI